MEAGPYLNAIYEDVFLERHPTGEAINLRRALGHDIDLGIIHYASDTPYTRAQTLGARGMSYYGMDSHLRLDHRHPPPRLPPHRHAEEVVSRESQFHAFLVSSRPGRSPRLLEESASTYSPLPRFFLRGRGVGGEGFRLLKANSRPGVSV